MTDRQNRYPDTEKHIDRQTDKKDTQTQKTHRQTDKQIYRHRQTGTQKHIC